jgi:hypothetical protein
MTRDLSRLPLEIIHRATIFLGYGFIIVEN